MTTELDDEITCAYCGIDMGKKAAVCRRGHPAGPMTDATTQPGPAVRWVTDRFMDYKRRPAQFGSDLMDFAREQDQRISSLEERLRLNPIACGVCWTGSWAPCEEGIANAVRDPQNEAAWMVCQMCSRDNDNRSLRQRIASLEAALKLIADSAHDPTCMKHQACIYAGAARAALKNTGETP